MGLVNMKLDPKTRAEQMTPMAVGGEAPLYPYGLQLRLDEEALEKLGDDDLPEVGTTLLLVAKVTVTSVSSNASTHGTHRNLELQITDLGLEPPGRDAAKTAAALYGKA